LSVPRVLALFVAVVLAAVATPGLAGTRRMAIVVGNNIGGPGRPVLRFAERDAARLGAVLSELGGFAPADVYVQQGQGRDALLARLGSITRTIGRWRNDDSDKVVLFFYFSGHSDGESLEMGADRFPFSDMKQALSQAGADLRILVLDSCRSGAFTAAKTGVPGPVFDIRLRDELATEGDATLTSSAADELALESRQLQASFFSHYLVSGLRGAADLSGDGQVTLGEVYRFVFDRTLSSTSATVAGPQHPTYDYRLSGRGELVLTDLRNRSAALRLPAQYDRILVTDAGTGDLVAETQSGGPSLLAVPAGSYRLLAHKQGRSHLARVSVGAGQEQAVRVADFDDGVRVEAVAKGQDRSRVAAAAAVGGNDGQSPASLTILGGITNSVADRLGPLPLLRVAYGGAGRWMPLASLSVASGKLDGIRETSTGLSLGLGLTLGERGVIARVGLEAGVGATFQQATDTSAGWSPFMGLTPSGLLGMRLGPLVAATVEVSGATMLLKRDGKVARRWAPMAAVGVLFSLR
jgi:hypothetical protein